MSVLSPSLLGQINIHKIFSFLFYFLINQSVYKITLIASERSTSKAPPAHYIVQIKSFSLLAEKAEEEYESGEFEVGGYKWYVCMYVCACVCVLN